MNSYAYSTPGAQWTSTDAAALQEVYGDWSRISTSPAERTSPRLAVTRPAGGPPLVRPLAPRCPTTRLDLLRPRGGVTPSGGRRGCRSGARRWEARSDGEPELAGRMRPGTGRNASIDANRPAGSLCVARHGFAGPRSAADGAQRRPSVVRNHPLDHVAPREPPPRGGPATRLGPRVRPRDPRAAQRRSIARRRGRGRRRGCAARGRRGARAF